jgi:hypothetical protein
MINSIRLICKVPKVGILGPILGPSFAKTMDEIQKGQDEDSTPELNRGSK